MTLENCFTYRRWAGSMLEEARVQGCKGAGQYWYLKGWCEKFDRLVSNFTCWPEHHDVYESGLKRLSALATSL